MVWVRRTLLFCHLSRNFSTHPVSPSERIIALSAAGVGKRGILNANVESLLLGVLPNFLLIKSCLSALSAQ